MTIFQCEDSIDGIFSAVYEAWSARLGHSNVKLEVMSPNAAYNMELFAEYRTTVLDMEKSEKVLSAVASKISLQAYKMAVNAALTDCDDKADCIYHFLVLGFHVGGEIVKYLTNPYVQRIFEMNRYVGGEAHLYKEFIRFNDIGNGALFACFHPKCNVTALIMPHFADRLPEENVIILDEGRRCAAVSPKGKPWFMTEFSEEEAERLIAITKVDTEFKTYWKSYFKAIAIKERENYKVQRQHAPIHFRKYMVEFE